ncbi:hypothetical protein AMECASPLE_006662 [Ameca splendens]|uniref:Secreted protein n=1 Tax=Ameca splendens TaxID=208324 RepID=A0ABV0XCK0_9TELE
MFRLFYSKSLLSLQLTSVAVDERRLVLSANQLHSCCNHGDAVSVVLPPDWENRSTRLRRDRVSAGNSLEHNLLLQASERKSSNAYTLISLFMNEYRIHKQ